MYPGSGLGFTKPVAGSQLNRAHLLGRMSSCWPLNEGAGIRANDIAGGNHGTLLNGAAFGGQGIAFDGVDDNINVGTGPSLRPTTAITLEARIYPTTLSLNKGIISVGAVYNLARGCALYLYGSNVYFGIGNGTTTAFNDEVSKTISANRRQHIVGTYDGSSIRLYVDGVLVSEDTSVISAIVYYATDLTTYIGMNRYTFGTGTRYFAGTIEKASIYPYALLPGDVARLAAEPYCMIEAPASRRYFIPLGITGRWMVGTVRLSYLLRTVELTPDA